MMWREARRRTSHPTRLCTKENSLQVIEADTEGSEATPSTPARRRVNAPGDGRGGKGKEEVYADSLYPLIVQLRMMCLCTSLDK